MGNEGMTEQAPVTEAHRRLAAEATYPRSRRLGEAFIEQWAKTGQRLRFSDGDTFSRLDRVAQAIANAERDALAARAREHARELADAWDEGWKNGRARAGFVPNPHRKGT